MKKVKQKVSRLNKFIISLLKKDLSILLPGLYILFLILGFLLTVLIYVFPQLVTCSKMLGSEFCSPTGVYLSFLASIPGYYIVGRLLGDYITKIPLAISFFMVVGTSILVYFFLGLFLQNLRTKSLFGKDTNAKMVLIAFIILAALLILLSI